jgi:hypothetical protein
MADIPLVDMARLMLDQAAPNGWTCRVDGIWCLARPAGYRSRRQGWKIHVSATPLSAPHVLARAVDVLAGHRCAFKFAATLADVAALTSTGCDRSAGGKFITVYPDDDDRLSEIGEDLHRRTSGLSGPVIMSDRPLSPGSLVHFRYGVFDAAPVLTNDGSFESMLLAPDGSLARDRRLAWFSPPPWAPAPLPDESPAAEDEEDGCGPVLLGKQFTAHRAIRHANRGGVYRATDGVTDREVVVKHARHDVGGALDGSDVRTLLRREAWMLDRLAPLGIAPRKVALFEQDGDLFLVEETIEGTTLEEWTFARADHDRGLLPNAALEIARGLIELLATIHAEGLVCCDLTPSNVMVTPRNGLRLVDVEGVAEPGKPMTSMYTATYAAPEQLAAPEFAPAPLPPANLFSLGAMLFFVVSGVHPVLAPERPVARCAEDRLVRWLSAMAAENRAARLLRPLIAGLTPEDPGARWTLDRARAFVSDPDPPPAVAGPPPSAEERLGRARRLLSDGVAHLVDAMRPAGERYLWPASSVTANCDPRAVQHGAAGVLTRAAPALDDPRLLDAVRTAASWVDERMRSPQRLLPGLYFGHSGTAWALYEAGHLLEDPGLRERAISLAKAVPVPWPNPDVCHGTAGAGMAQLHFLQATGDRAFAERAHACARALVVGRERREHGLVWPIPSDFDSALRGIAHNGYAHGVAGIGTFLLLAAGRLDCPQYLRTAKEAGESLAATVAIEDGEAWWPSGEVAEPAHTRLAHWCSGSSGIGTFLVRLWRETGDPGLLDLCARAAAAVRRDRWQAPTCACHGLAGDGEFLVDMADIAGDRRCRDWALDLFTCLDARSYERNGRLLVPDESGTVTTAGYGIGLAGVMAFLLRLCHGGPRLWIPTRPVRTAEEELT